MLRRGHATSLDVEKSHVAVKRSEASRVVSVSSASRNMIIQRYRTFRILGRWGTTHPRLFEHEATEQRRHFAKFGLVGIRFQYQCHWCVVCTVLAPFAGEYDGARQSRARKQCASDMFRFAQWPYNAVLILREPPETQAPQRSPSMRLV